MAVRKFDRANFYPVVLVNGTPQLNFLAFSWINFRKILRDQRIQTHTVTSADEGNLPLISFRFYSDTSQWWIIAIANNLLDPIEAVSIGAELVIPTPSQIESFYQSIVRGQRQAGSAKFRKPII